MSRKASLLPNFHFNIAAKALCLISFTISAESICPRNVKAGLTLRTFTTLINEAFAALDAHIIVLVVLLASSTCKACFRAARLLN
jgi:hypothetical protein